MQNIIMIESRYLDGSYLFENPDWDREDSPWKASMIFSILSKNNIHPKTICDVGCGTGDVLISLIKNYPFTNMIGYDISPQLPKYWVKHKKDNHEKAIEFYLGDFHEMNQSIFDVLLLLDVFEHIRDPYSFLEKSKYFAPFFIFHIPLDLSVISVLRKNPLIFARKKVGHLNFYSKDLAIRTLMDSGYDIIEWEYTNAFLNSPNRSFKTRLLSIPHRIIAIFNKDFAVRLFGGETLLVLAKPSVNN